MYGLLWWLLTLVNSLHQQHFRNIYWGKWWRVQYLFYILFYIYKLQMTKKIKNESKCNGISRILKGQIWQMKSSDCLYLLDHNRNAPAFVCLICVIIVQDCGCVTCKQCCTHLWFFQFLPLWTAVHQHTRLHTQPHTLRRAGFRQEHRVLDLCKLHASVALCNIPFLYCC